MRPHERASLDVSTPSIERTETETLARRASDLRTTLVQLGLPPKPRPEEAAVVAVRASEIRQRFGQLDPLAARIAHAKGTPEVQRALEDDPLSCLPRDYVQEVIEARSRERDPRRWEDLEDMEMLSGAMSGVLAAARVALGENPEAPPVVQPQVA